MNEDLEKNVEQDTENKPPKKKNMPLIIVGLIIICIIGFGVGWYFGTKDEKKEESKTAEKKDNKESKEEQEGTNEQEETGEERGENGGIVLVCYCGDEECFPEKDIDHSERFEYQCSTSSSKECYMGRRENNIGPRYKDDYMYPDIITDKGRIVLNSYSEDKQKYDYKCINNDCMYVNHIDDTLFVYDGGNVYSVNLKTNEKKKLDIKYKDVFEGLTYEADNGTQMISDGTIEYLQVYELAKDYHSDNSNYYFFDSNDNVYDKSILIYTNDDGGQAPNWYIYNTSNNTKSNKYYDYLGLYKLNGKEYIFGNTTFTEPGYADILDKNTGKILKSYTGVDSFILDEKNKLILVAEYQGEAATFEGTYKVKYKLNYNLEEVK